MMDGNALNNFLKAFLMTEFILWSMSIVVLILAFTLRKFKYRRKEIVTEIGIGNLVVLGVFVFLYLSAPIFIWISNLKIC